MSEVQEGRDSDNNWVIAGSTEGLPVESLGAAHTEAPHVQEEQKDQSAAPGPDRCQDAPETNGSSAPKDTKEGEIPPSPTAATVAHQEEVDMPPEELSTTSQEPGEPLTKPVLGLPRTVGEELEEVSCSSSEDDVEGLRKRVVRGAAPVTVGPSPRESSEQETDGGFGLTLNKCIIIALALVGIGFLAFSGSGFGTEEDSPQTVVQRSVDGDDKQPQVIEDIQAWIQQHAAEFAGDPGSLQVISGLLDKVAKENQEIRHMQATLQAQKEELETLLKTGEGQKVTPSPQHQDLMEENVRLKDALLKEETAHLSATEELQGLRDKMEVLDRSVLEKEGLVSENAKLKEDLESSRVQIEGFLAQKETLVAESQMLRQELDKQRSLVTSIRRDLENLTTQTDNLEVVSEQQLQSKITDLSNRLAMEFQRSETWEKKYVEHARKRKEQTKEEWRDHGHKEWKKGDKSARTPNISSTSGDFHKHSADFKHGKEHAKKWKEESPKESQHEEWKTKKHDHREDKREKHWEDKREKHSEDKKHRHWEGEHRGKEHQHDSAHQHENKERSWKEKHHHEGERDGGFHPRKDQKEFSKTIKEEENTQRKHQGEKAHSKDSQHRHHDHNKFWKKLSDHQYRIPVGCAGLEDCARKDGIDLFNVELKPVQRKQFENVLQSYLTKVGLSKHLPQLIPLLDGFFDGPVFSHQKIRFRDFVDDVEDFLEDLAKKETGNDDIVDDFEKYVYTNFFGEAATNKKRSSKKEAHKKNNPTDSWQGSPLHKSQHHHNTGNLNKTSKLFQNQVDSRPTDKKKHFTDGGDSETRQHKPYEKKYEHNDRQYHYHKQQTPNLQYENGESSHQQDHQTTSNKVEDQKRRSYQTKHKPCGHHFDKDDDQFHHHEHKSDKPHYIEDKEHSYSRGHIKSKDGQSFQHKQKPHYEQKEENYHKNRDYRQQYEKDDDNHHKNKDYRQQYEKDDDNHHKNKDYRQQYEKDDDNHHKNRDYRQQYEKDDDNHHKNKDYRQQYEKDDDNHHKNRDYRQQYEKDDDNHHKNKDYRQQYEKDDDNHHKNRDYRQQYEDDDDHHKNRDYRQQYEKDDDNHHKNKDYRQQYEKDDDNHHKNRDYRQQYEKDDDNHHNKHKDYRQQYEKDDDNHHKNRDYRQQYEKEDDNHHKNKDYRQQYEKDDDNHHKHKDYKHHNEKEEWQHHHHKTRYQDKEYGQQKYKKYDDQKPPTWKYGKDHKHTHDKSKEPFQHHEHGSHNLKYEKDVTNMHQESSSHHGKYEGRVHSHDSISNEQKQWKEDGSDHKHRPSAFHMKEGRPSNHYSSFKNDEEDNPKRKQKESHKYRSKTGDHKDRENMGERAGW